MVRRWLNPLLPWVLPAVIGVEVVLILAGVIDLKVGLLVVLVIEGVLAVLVVTQLRLIIVALRRARAAGADTPQALEQAFDGLLPRPLARVLRHDVLLYRALWFAVRGRHDTLPNESPVRYGRETRVLLWTLLVVDGAIAVLVHIIVPWPTLRTILLIVDILAMIWFVGFLASLYVYPHTIGPRRLRLRYAALQDFSFPVNLIETVRVEQRSWTTWSSADVIDETLVLPVPSSTNVMVTLRCPVEVRLRNRGPQTVRRLAFAADEPPSACAVISSYIPVTS